MIFEIDDPTGSFGVSSKQLTEDKNDVNSSTYGVIYLKKPLDYEDSSLKNHQIKVKISAENKLKGTYFFVKQKISYFLQGQEEKS